MKDGNFFWAQVATPLSRAIVEFEEVKQALNDRHSVSDKDLVFLRFEFTLRELRAALNEWGKE